MCAVRTVVARDDLAGLARAALGAGHRLTSVSRLRGGTSKGVYRLSFDDGGTAVAYLWAGDENYWPAGGENPAHPFARACGLSLFEAAHRELEAAGVRTPRVYFLDRSGRHYPADAAVVEDVAGGDLKTLLDRDPRAAEGALGRLTQTLRSMEQRQSHQFGKVAFVRGGGAATGGTCEQVVLERARAHLAEAAGREPRIGAARTRFESVLGDLAAQVRPRREYRLVHGELGPEHLLVDSGGAPVLIDTEGLMFFDVEWEHAFLRMRFGPHYRLLERAGLDEHRMSLYTLALRLSLVAGPLRLLDGDFPGRGGMMSIAEHNTRQALALLP